MRTQPKATGRHECDRCDRYVLHRVARTSPRPSNIGGEPGGSKLAVRRRVSCIAGLSESAGQCPMLRGRVFAVIKIGINSVDHEHKDDCSKKGFIQNLYYY